MKRKTDGIFSGIASFAALEAAAQRAARGKRRKPGVAILPTRPDGARVTGGRTTGGAGARTGYVRFLQIGGGLPKMEPRSSHSSGSVTKVDAETFRRGGKKKRR